MGFDSYHWQEYSIPDPQLAEHREKLASGMGGPDDFLALLHSGDPVAVGVALDQYKQAEALTRFGGSHPYGEQDSAVREVARRVLAEPPYPIDEEDGDEPGLNHASALLVLAHLAAADDCDRIAGIVRTRPSPSVMNAAGQAAARALMASESLSENLVEALGAVLLDESGGTRDRLDALGAFRYVRDERVGEILERAAHTRDERVQAEVVAVLVNHFLATRMNVVDEVTASWEPNPSRIQERILRALEEAKRHLAGPEDSPSQTDPGMETT
ncbi:hypothetical protein I2W78_32940 [Streptomyces spinoverrucosus]|uniref:hypothetical protein n=1 Tax=Streptomyces spinoverrucosus TaxID=284043 RepID=UPI0018C3D9B7|nr:hypothetical protein [Streptomyces spinoverrucosus]MBG0856537.1 hypothetical protein [Streptomyces spinoverrucosus]